MGMLTVPDARKTGKIFKRCSICKAEKYLPVNEKVCERCKESEPLKIGNVKHINPPVAGEPKERKIKKPKEKEKWKFQRKYWVV